jgi:small GTP-binding protein
MANQEIARRRTFAIIAHPDAGKTSLTEKLLLFGGQIQVAGAVKSNKIKKTATSDWMDIEKQRGISVTTSVMEFDYHDYKINILDTPGHQDFAEDTYRTLTAVDSVIIVVDGAKGVETQTRKLMEVCRMRNTPVIIFVNKMDREAKDPFDLLDELEEELVINVRPLTWPIESGPRFKGVYNIYEQKLNLFQPSKQVVTEKVEVDIHTEDLDNHIGTPLAEKLRSELELIDGVYPEFNVDDYLKGELAPVFFGSALNNFGVQELLDCFVEIAPSPRPVQAEEREVQPEEPKFTGFVFKITANIDPNHRSCVAFCKVCSGKFTRNTPYLHVRHNKTMRFFSQVEPPPRFIRKLKEPPLNRTNIFFGESHSDWLPVRGGESGDFVFRRGDGHAFAKIAPASRRGELAGERDRLIWLKGRGVACPEVINWQEEQEGACLVITAIPGVPAADLSGADLLKAWPSMGQQLGAVHSLSVDQCPFERRLSRMFGRAVDVVSRNAVNPDFLPDEDKSTPQLDLLARVERELPVRLDQERTDMVVCHGDPCMPNFMVDPKTLQCTGLIDLGRLGTADRYADLALMIANAEENWAAPDEAERAFAVLFNVLGIEAPDRERLAFYLRLDPLTWG